MKKIEEILVEFIPFGGIKVGGGFTPKRTMKRKGFKEYFKASYGTTKGARFGKAKQTQYVKGSGQSKTETVGGWGIFIPKEK